MVLSPIGFIGLALGVHVRYAYLGLVIWMAVIGMGADIFNSPSTSGMMTAAGYGRRGEVSGIRALATNTGMMLSIALVFAVVAGAARRDIDHFYGYGAHCPPFCRSSRLGSGPRFGSWRN